VKPQSDFPLPYQQNFDNEALSAPPRLWYDQMGAFEIQPRVGGPGNVMRQVVPIWPDCWGYSCSGEAVTLRLIPAYIRRNRTPHDRLVVKLVHGSIHTQDSLHMLPPPPHTHTLFFNSQARQLILAQRFLRAAST